MARCQISYLCFTTDFSISGADGTDFQVIHASRGVERTQTNLLLPLLGRAVRNALNAHSVVDGSFYIEFPTYQIHPVILIPIHRPGHLLDPRHSVRLFAFLPRWTPESGRSLLEVVQQLQQFAMQQAEVLLVTSREDIERIARALQMGTAVPDYCEVELAADDMVNEETNSHSPSDTTLTLTRLEGTSNCDIWPLIRHGRLPFAVGGWFKVDPAAVVFEESIALLNLDELSRLNSDSTHHSGVWQRFSSLIGRELQKRDHCTSSTRRFGWAQAKACFRKIGIWYLAMRKRREVCSCVNTDSESSLAAAESNDPEQPREPVTTDSQADATYCLQATQRKKWDALMVATILVMRPCHHDRAVSERKEESS